MGSKFGSVFGATFVLAGSFFLLLLLIAPERQDALPVWVNVLAGALFILVGVGVYRMQRDPKSVPFWAGLMCIAVGAFIMIASGFDPDDARFHAPRWVVAAAGATFLFAGIAVIKTGGATTQHPGQNYGSGYGLILALLLTCFAAVANWVAFGPGERTFRGELGAGANALPFDIGEIFGRLLFSPAALLLDAMAIAAWFFLFRGLARRHRADGETPKVRLGARRR